MTVRSLGIKMPLQSHRLGVDDPAAKMNREVGMVVCSEGWRGPIDEEGPVAGIMNSAI